MSTCRRLRRSPLPNRPPPAPAEAARDAAGGFFETKIAAVLSHGSEFADFPSALAACGGVASGMADRMTLWLQTGGCEDAALLDLLRRSRGSSTPSSCALVHRVAAAPATHHKK